MNKAVNAMHEKTETNREGLTFSEWYAAACGGAGLDKGVAILAWDNGEDPTEYRAMSPNDRAALRLESGRIVLRRQHEEGAGRGGVHFDALMAEQDSLADRATSHAPGIALGVAGVLAIGVAAYYALNAKPTASPAKPPVLTPVASSHPAPAASVATSSLQAAPAPTPVASSHPAVSTPAYHPAAAPAYHAPASTYTPPAIDPSSVATADETAAAAAASAAGNYNPNAYPDSSSAATDGSQFQSQGESADGGGGSAFQSQGEGTQTAGGPGTMMTAMQQVIGAINGGGTLTGTTPGLMVHTPGGHTVPASSLKYGQTSANGSMIWLGGSTFVPTHGPQGGLVAQQAAQAAAQVAAAAPWTYVVTGGSAPAEGTVAMSGTSTADTPVGDTLVIQQYGVPGVTIQRCQMQADGTVVPGSAVTIYPPQGSA